MTLDISQQMLIEQRIANDAKSPLLAYLLLIFVGWFGVHRFYLGRTGTGVAMLVLSIIGFLTVAIGVGMIPLAVVGIWCVVDLFLIPGMVTSHKEQLRAQLAGSMTSAASTVAA